MERGISEIDYQVSIIFNVVHRPYHSYELGSTIHVMTCAIYIIEYTIRTEIASLLPVGVYIYFLLLTIVSPETSLKEYFSTLKKVSKMGCCCCCC